MSLLSPGGPMDPGSWDHEGRPAFQPCSAPSAYSWSFSVSAACLGWYRTQPHSLLFLASSSFMWSRLSRKPSPSPVGSCTSCPQQSIPFFREARADHGHKGHVPAYCLAGLLSFLFVLFCLFLKKNLLQFLAQYFMIFISDFALWMLNFCWGWKPLWRKGPCYVLAAAEFPIYSSAWHMIVTW